MPVWSIILLIVIGVLLAVLVALYIVGRKLQKKRSENQVRIDAMAQNTSMLVIDKKKMRLKDADLPKIVLEQTPKYMRRTKVPIVKAKIGPRIMTLVAEESVFDLIPIKQEIRATISGIYITAVRSGRGGNLLPAPKKKPTLRERLSRKAQKGTEVLEAKKEKRKNKA